MPHYADPDLYLRSNNQSIAYIFSQCQMVLEHLDHASRRHYNASFTPAWRMTLPHFARSA